MADADNCYYQFRVDQFQHQNLRDDPFMYALNLGAWIFYGYGKKPFYPLVCAIMTIMLFIIVWLHGGWETPTESPDLGIFEKYGCTSHGRPEGKNWRNDVRLLGSAMIFSATIFLSGTRLFVDPPKLPELPRWSKSTTRFVFTAERVLGAFFSILFFLAIGATVIR